MIPDDRDQESMSNLNFTDLGLSKQKRLVSLKLDYESGSIVLRAVQAVPHADIIEIAKEYGYVIDPNNFAATFEKAYTQLMRAHSELLPL